MRINFDFMDLEAFLAVKETTSFHAASERLNMSQSSITRRIQKLERALGTELFERTTRDVRPTLAAKRLQLRAEAILQDAQETTRAMRDESATYAYQRAQTVTLATVPTVVSRLIAPAILAFRAAGHTARIRLLDLSANDVAEAVAQGDADFGICSIPAMEPVTDFRFLFNETIGLALMENHRLAREKNVGWSDLAQETLILPARGTGNRLLIDEALARNDIRVAWTYEVGRSTTALEMVSQNIGVAPLPQAAVSGVFGDEVVWKTVGEPEVSRPIGLLTRVDQSESEAVSGLRKAIIDQVTGDD